MKLFNSDCLALLKKARSNSIDALVTDPPAGISFMNKEWDDDKGGRDGWIAWMTDVMKECYRVMKPGAHGLVWAIPRTSHWTATALENAGFEVRDVVTHLFGTGFPKSLNVGKQTGRPEHQGTGTALKPASEHWILVRKPISEKTVAANMLKWGVGGLNIDACRVEAVDQDKFSKNWDREKITDIRGNKYNAASGHVANTTKAPQGRFPANLVLDEEAAKILDAQSGELKGPWGKNSKDHKNPIDDGIIYGKGLGGVGSQNELRSKETVGASRFFYVAKASTSEKNIGLEEMPDTIVSDGRQTTIDNSYLRGETKRKNTHPTVKSIKLMEYLIKLITPPGGKILDPFMGSGSTGVAAKNLGFEFIGIEKELEYFEIAKARINAKA